MNQYGAEAPHWMNQYGAEAPHWMNQYGAEGEKHNCSYSRMPKTICF